MCTVFICHDQRSMDMVHAHLDHPDVYIMLVGIHADPPRHPRIVVACEQPDNIEKEHKLLTFTAWYAIVKNNLFSEYDYVSLLEYDCIVPDMAKFAEITRTEIDVVSFFRDGCCFYCDITPACLHQYLRSKDILTTYDNSTTWACTTNHCLRKDVLRKFVDWYFPTCLYFKKSDYTNFSFYHERIFAVFVAHYNISQSIVCGDVSHNMSNSHGLTRYLPVDDFDWVYYLEINPDVVTGMPGETPKHKAIDHYIHYGHREKRQYKAPAKKYFLVYDDESGKYDLQPLLASVRAHSSFEVLVFTKSQIDAEFATSHADILSLARGGGYWLWKPYIIQATLRRVEEGSILFYMDSSYAFVRAFDDIVDEIEKTDFLVWKNKPNEPVYPMKQWCKMDVMHRYLKDELHREMEVCWAGAIACKNTVHTRSLVAEWLQMCCHAGNITDSPSDLPNSADFIEHRHDQTLLTIALFRYNIPLRFLDKHYLQNTRQPW